MNSVKRMRNKTLQGSSVMVSISTKISAGSLSMTMTNSLLQVTETNLAPAIERFQGLPTGRSWMV